MLQPTLVPDQNKEGTRIAPSGNPSKFEYTSEDDRKTTEILTNSGLNPQLQSDNGLFRPAKHLLPSVILREVANTLSKNLVHVA